MKFVSSWQTLNYIERCLAVLLLYIKEKLLRLLC